MARRMPGRRDDHHRAVAEHIVIALELRHRMLGLKARCAALARPLVFGLLHIEHHLRKQLDIADVVGMGVRDRHSLDVGGLDAERIELRRQRLGPLEPSRLRSRRRHTLGHAATASARPVSHRNQPCA